MPISPKEIAEQRLTTTINKLCDLIDKKLLESDSFPFVFTFLPNTSPDACTAIAETYRRNGWSASLTTKDTDLKAVVTVLTLTPKLTFASSLNACGANYIQDTIIKSMSTVEGLHELGAVMVESIGTGLLYQSSLRKILMVDILPQNEFPNFEHQDLNNSIYYTHKHVIEPFCNVNKSTPFVELRAMEKYESDVSKKYEFGNSKREIPASFYTLDRMQVGLKDSLQEQESQIMVKLLEASTRESTQVIHTYPQTLGAAILDSMAEIESNQIIPAKLMLHPRAYRRFLNDDFGSLAQFEKATARDILISHHYGRLHDMDVHVNAAIPYNEIFISAPAAYVGRYLIQENVTVLPVEAKQEDEHDDGNPGFMAYTKVLPIITNPKAVQKIVVRF